MMKKILASLFVVALIAGCQQTYPTTSGNCDLGAKSGGTTTATAAECKDLGGKFTG